MEKMDYKMFCYQCEETAKNEGCTVQGVCGKTADTANLQDLLVYVLKGISFYGEKLRELGSDTDEETDVFITRGLFATVTNTNFDSDDFVELIDEAQEIRKKEAEKFNRLYKEEHGSEYKGSLPPQATWKGTRDEYEDKAFAVGVLTTKDEDVRSLRELLTYGIKGIAAYNDHAYILDKKDKDIFNFMQKGLAATLDDSLTADELTGL
ncbi:MAG: hydroxylamine reductase, partial [Bacillota bacterium]